MSSFKPPLYPPSNDSETLNSHENDSVQLNADVALIDESKHPHVRRAFRSIPQSRRSHYSEATLNENGLPHTFIPRRPVVPLDCNASVSGVSDVSEPVPRVIPSQIPPIGFHKPPPLERLDTVRAQRNMPPQITADVARKAIAQARKRKGSVVNEDDAWRKIKFQRDEEDADTFRQDRLLERCWEIWKQGFQWIITTNIQISEARDNLLLRLSLQRWQNIATSHRDLHTRIARLADDRYTRTAFHKWQKKLKERRQDKWRHEMRMKMKHIKERGDLELKKDAWARWRQLHRSRLASQQYSHHLLFRCYARWKQRLCNLDAFEATADAVSRTAVLNDAKKCFVAWKKLAILRTIERHVVEQVNMRITCDIVDNWRRRMQDYRRAKEYHTVWIMKRALLSWRSSLTQIGILERRATKHIARSNDLLLRAILRVWGARERGNLLLRVKLTRLLKVAWGAWQTQLNQRKENQDRAVAFSLRPNSQLASTFIRRWMRVYETHKHAQSFAVQYDAAQVRDKTTLYWRVLLRKKLKMAKTARLAARYFAVRQAWKVWKERLEELKRQQQLKQILIAKKKAIFDAWLNRYRREASQKRSYAEMQERISKRIIHNALTYWTNRVVEVKLRALEVAQKYDIVVQTAAFQKWKKLCVRHAEELSLMESYLFVKREDVIRRMFHRWFAAARSTRHRRLTLQRKEDQMKLATITFVWDKWRDQFISEKLRPMEYDVILQNQKNLMFLSFGIWLAKTKSLPAIRFHANHTKFKFFKVWRDSMPRALQAKAARERDRQSTLRHFISKWIQTYRSKIALKAVARARYLRLPTARPTLDPSGSALSTNHNLFPRRFLRQPDDDDEKDIPTSYPVGRAPGGNLGLLRPPRSTGYNSLLPSHFGARASSPTPSKASSARPQSRADSPARSKASLARPQSRADSPPRSKASSVGSAEPGSRKLWLELQEVQRKSRSPFRETKKPP